MKTSRKHLEAMYSILRRSRKRKQIGPMTFDSTDERVEVVWNKSLDCPGEITVTAKRTGIKRVYTLEETAAP